MPATQGAETSASAALEELGLRIYEPFSVESQADASIRLANLVAFTLWKGKKRNAGEIERLLDANAAEFHQFTAWVASQEFIPVEASPLHGVSRASLLKKGSLSGFAIFAEGFGLMHHDRCA